MKSGRASEVFGAFFSLGLRSFGGPIAHLGYFRDEFVGRRRWLDDHAYADLVALCQFLPGPASSQVGMALGYGRAGYAGACAAFVAFTLPSALFMLALAAGASFTQGDVGLAIVHGLKLAAVAVVAQAVLAMARNLTPDFPRRMIAVATGVIVLLVPHAWMQILVIVGGGLVGWRVLQPAAVPVELTPFVHPPRQHGIVLLGLFACLLLIALAMQQGPDESFTRVLAVFYKAGSLVFGGGHVVLPMLEAGLVPWAISDDLFLAGYGAAQALPGPLFTFAAFVGSAMTVTPHGVVGGLAALVAIFLPAMLLVLGALPFWAGLRAQPQARRALAGVNAAVVGVLAAALYDPVILASVRNVFDVAIVAVCLLLLEFWKRPSWWVVLFAPAAVLIVRLV